MKSLTSRQKILFCVYAMILAMIGDYLLGFGTFCFSDSPDAYMGMTANVVPDWRYASSSVLGFICAALFAVAATELMKVMEKKYGLAESKLYKLFKIANWAGSCTLPSSISGSACFLSCSTREWKQPAVCKHPWIWSSVY